MDGKEGKATKGKDKRARVGGSKWRLSALFARLPSQEKRKRSVAYCAAAVVLTGAVHRRTVLWRVGKQFKARGARDRRGPPRGRVRLSSASASALIGRVEPATCSSASRVQSGRAADA